MSLYGNGKSDTVFFSDPAVGRSDLGDHIADRKEPWLDISRPAEIPEKGKEIEKFIALTQDLFGMAFYKGIRTAILQYLPAGTGNHRKRSRQFLCHCLQKLDLRLEHLLLPCRLHLSGLLLCQSSSASPEEMTDGTQTAIRSPA